MPAQIPLSQHHLIETLGFSRAAGFARLELHLARLAASSRALGHEHDRVGVMDALERVARDTAGDHLRVRLEQAADGSVAVTAAAFAPLAADAVWKVAVASYRLNPSDDLLAHKTTRRDFYDEGRREVAQRADEALFLNTRGEVCEGGITSVFVERGGKLLTPPLSSGLLAGVLRAELLETGRAVEAVLGLDDLADGFFVGNSLRGLIKAQLAPT
jgi:branched-subunit amino acid aminotransferase/4-amino-4-deoxychorismate lyase